MPLQNRIYILTLLCLLSISSSGQLSYGEYFFDVDPGVGNGHAISFGANDSLNLNVNIPITGLSVGFHNLFIRFGDIDGNWGIPEGRPFVITTLDSLRRKKIKYAEYFIDTDPGNGLGISVSIPEGDSVSSSLFVPTAAMTPGFHRLYVRYADINKAWGIPESRPFFIATLLNQGQKVKYGEYFIDTDPGMGLGTPITVTEGDSVNSAFFFPVSTLTTGFHKLFVRYADINKHWSIPETRPFVIMTISAHGQKIKYGEYFVDTDPGNGAGTPIAMPADADSIDLNLALPQSKPPGFHNLFIRFADVNKKWGIPEARSFFINKYQFLGNGSWSTPANWLNSLVPPNIITNIDEVYINPAPGGQCTYSGNMSVLNGGKLDVQSGKILNITGDFDNDGALLGTGTINFNGAGLSTLSSSGTVSPTLRLTSKTMHLARDTKTNTINLIGGSTIALDNFDLDVGSSAITGVSSNNFIITNATGSLKRSVGNSAISFPVGISSTSYNPVIITNTGTADSFSVRVTQGVVTHTIGINSGAVNRTWIIDESLAGGSNLNLTMQWNLSDEQPGFNRNNCYIAKVCPPPTGCVNGYEDLTGAVSSGTNPYTITRNGFTLLNSSDTLIVRTPPPQYIFTGNGNWSDPVNWSTGVVPPSPIPSGWEIIIDPPSGTCTFTGNLILEAGAILKVQPGKSLIVTGNLIQL